MQVIIIPCILSIGMIESRRVVRVLCEYISLQCSRPPPAHSKDLHSTIVAAFTCCAAWLSAHPYLTADNDCLHAVLQVIELGISGSKSQVLFGRNVMELELKFYLSYSGQSRRCFKNET